jgi:large subunit ribosomal protein L6e
LIHINSVILINNTIVFIIIKGPYGINGVPLRRINQSYVIATSTKVDLKGVSIPATINDAYFAKAEGAKKTVSAEDFFAQGPKKVALPDKRKADQKTVDAALLKAINAVPSLKLYLNSKFSLTNSDKPHLMKF